MADCYLTERQKDLMRSLVPGLKDDSVKAEWGILLGDIGINNIGGITKSLWNTVWNGVSEADFDAFVDCGFFRFKGSSRYTLNIQKIISAVENDFQDRESSLPAQQNTIFGVPAISDQLKGDIFMMMPFQPEFYTVYNNHIKPVVESLSLKILVGDEPFTGREILHDIWSMIHNVRIIIVDCTGKNANVFYELGIAHALNKPAIMISQNEQDAQFDVRGKRFIFYKNTLEGRTQLEGELRTAIMRLTSELDG